ncbi:hypothetical protein UFOVP141_6 [uncultured Caudovirales phage]|uniref:Uncharacterized protein n=1 Tax=uncultured Caudovirales phage TaxID=2100421 RepID=A0A6J7VPL7_9CAUD|nr:hypothetical protein UFOVP141_6 [uncultured Caudovirales phage]
MSKKPINAVPSIENAIAEVQAKSEAAKPDSVPATPAPTDIAAPIIADMQWLANVCGDLERHTNSSQVEGFRREAGARINRVIGTFRQLAASIKP